ncbi:hypothetical protein BE21_54080 [Sorangium cellulosum]|uniref:Uncharacterized protein n=1 Tax=Sorangium cellulosum TaxID=56 RepID=A0A150TE12_SORCE|nr:hypothetical protein BE21_54080 [Sorangium cellulosum]
MDRAEARTERDRAPRREVASPSRPVEGARPGVEDGRPPSSLTGRMTAKERSARHLERGNAPAPAAPAATEKPAAAGGDKKPAAAVGGEKKLATEGDKKHAAADGEKKHAAAEGEGDKKPVAADGEKKPDATAEGDKKPAAAKGDRKPHDAGDNKPHAAHEPTSARAGAGPAGARSPRTPAQDPAFQAFRAGAIKYAHDTAAHPPATQKVDEAHAAAKSPPTEVPSQAAARHMGELEQQPRPAFDAAAFKKSLMDRIEQVKPKTLEDADNFKNDNSLGGVKEDITKEVDQGKDKTVGPVEQKNQETPSEADLSPKPVSPLEPAPPAARKDLGAARAAPKPRTPAEVSFDRGPKQLKDQMAGANVTEPQLQRSNEPSFQAAVSAKHTAEKDAREAPGRYRQTEKVELHASATTAVTGADTATTAMSAGRNRATQQVLAKQDQGKTKDERARAQVAEHIQKLYEESKQKVEARLARLDQEVNKEFDDGAAAARKSFEDYVGQRMDAYKSDRYGGAFGWLSWIGDKLFGMPGEVDKFYEEGKQKFIDAMGTTIDKIAGMVEAGLNEAMAEVAQGKKAVDAYVNSLPAELKHVGEETRAQIQGQFDALEQQIEDKQTDLVDGLAQKYTEKVRELDARIEELKEANKGLIQKAFEFIKGVIQTIVQLAQMLFKILARVAGLVGKILKDPIGFVKNLVRGAKGGFERFVNNVSARPTPS